MGRTRKGKRSEQFWPAMVMRKWLNMKPNVHEFSADEFDTESEDDGAGLDLPPVTLEINGSCQYHDSGKEVKGHVAKLQRTKSETLRANYITKKEIRVMIGTWNVAGRVPEEDINLDDWLNTNEPSDLYVLGFQEIVPLNAGNVFGAEDRRPIKKWEAIIRKTLNKSLHPKSIPKSYSDPTSPVSKPFLSARVSDSYSFRNEEYSRQTTLWKEFDWENSKATRGATELNWPEHALDEVAPGKSLRRVMSSSANMGFKFMGEAQLSDSNDLASKACMTRLYNSSGNLGMLWSEQQEASDVLRSLNEDSFSSSEEEESFTEEIMKVSKKDSNEHSSKHRAAYVRIVSKQMVGIYISMWVSRRLRRHINNLKVSPVGVGLMGYMGNKGSVSVSMSLFQTRFCFVCSHLTSGHKDGDQNRRNSDVYDILQRTRFSPALDADQPNTIPSHDRIFWFGDLNYRLDLSDAEVRALVATKKWNELMNSDQLTKELRSGHIFDGWKEGLIDFPPTYKYGINSNKYVGEKAKEGEKKRSPAWCDRILWSRNGIKQLSYWRTELSFSDHRPVSSIFSVEVEIFDERKLKRLLNFTNAGLLPDNNSEVSDDW